MDTGSFGKINQSQDLAGKPSRLPAGSTLLVNGIHVPHPHAEVNLAGAGDTRLGDTEAVTEFVRTTRHDDDTVTAELVAEPLHDVVKPSRLTTDPKAPRVDGAAKEFATGAASSAELDQKEDPQNKVVELTK